MLHLNLAETAEPKSEARPPRTGRVVFWRSVLFNVLMVIVVFFTALLTTPALLFMRREAALAVAKWWAQRNLDLLRVVVGIELEIRGRENIPTGPALIAMKHQSELETFGVVPFIPDPVFVLKRELTWIPLFGWFLKRLEMIAINRSSGAEALIQILEQADKTARDGRQIIIFPEGTRRPIGAPPTYKQGVTHLYDRLKLPCVPVAIDTGVFWPRGTTRRRQGRSVIEFLPAIPPGMPRAEFEATVKERIEQATNALVAEALGER